MKTVVAHRESVDLTAVERQAHDLRAQATAAAFRSAWTWLGDHLHFGKSPSAS
ncbi:RSP_7527 family protein [Dinoroseobacter sp. S76]|uniref:RSP_7527 family protein n=1 Tax=Dinoroseobacter sp. S76 TaxID=3415124 RepID=UPI003C7B3826